MISPKRLIKNATRMLGYNITPVGLVRDDGYLDKAEFQYILWLDRIYEKISRVPGNIVEIGVANGRNSIIFGRFIDLHGERAVRRYYGFDTFEGYVPSDMAKEAQLGHNSFKDASYEAVSRRIRDVGLKDVCYLIKGDVRETAPRFVSERQASFHPNYLKVALLYIDCNAFDPALFSMNFFAKYMSDGGVICIDEKVEGGESRALDLFCAENGFTVTRDPGPFGIPAYAVIRKECRPGA